MKKKTTTTKTGVFGPIYTQFKNKPKEAILHLKKVRTGECLNAMYRKETGFVSIVWGENDPKTNEGYGLKHIIEKHGKQIKKAGYKVEEFVPFAFEFGKVEKLVRSVKIIIESDKSRMILSTKWFGKNKTLLLTSFAINKKTPKKRKPKV